MLDRAKPSSGVACVPTFHGQESNEISECSRSTMPGRTCPYPLASSRVLALLFIVLAMSLGRSMGISDSVEVRALEAIKRTIGDDFNRLSNWRGNDPCGTNWTGVICKPINGTGYVTELRLLNMNFTGTLAPDLGNLTQLAVMDFMWNNITGPIPAEIGYLKNLVLLLLNGNKLNGVLAPELGNLTSLTRFQIDSNSISGSIPPSFQRLNKVKHLHMNNNSLNGSIPPQLGGLQSVIHILFDNNKLSGELPAELANISTLLILQLDNNHFGGSIPANWSNMVLLTKLSLRNCNLNGTIPDLSAMTTLKYLDLSQNQLTGELPANLSQAISTIDLSYNHLTGELSPQYYQFLVLETLRLQNNSLEGNITAAQLNHNGFSKDSVLILDFQNNSFTGFTSGAILAVQNITMRLFGNPVCTNSIAPSDLCDEFHGLITDVTISSNLSTLAVNCPDSVCDLSRNSEIHYGLLAFGECKCVYPLTVRYRLKSPSFAVYPPYESSFEDYLSSSIKLAKYQVNASIFSWEPGPRLSLIIKLYPSNNTRQFSEDDVQRLYTQYVTWDFPDNKTFGPYEMIAFDILYPYNNSDLLVGSSKSGLSGGAIAGVVLGAAALTAVIVGMVMLAIARRSYRRAMAGRRTARQYERLKIDGVRDFTFEEMTKATNNFDSANQIGQGGYGRVYRGVLADGMVVAVKRAQEGSLQGGKEFVNELELLSRVHHRNLLTLVGFCDDEGEQMLVYEFMPNGTLRDNLNFGSGKPLDFATRLQIALGSARGILYLHTEADPPIFHRDIKATNILLDKKLRAKVADFGLSKLAGAVELEGGAGAGVSTVVKGTPGYLDPEYFLTHKLTDKSDVYSFGVVLLELITGQPPISHGKNLVREVNLSYQSGMVLSIVDPRMGPYPSECLQPLLRLALACCMDDTDARPSMAEVVRELEAIWRLMPVQDSMSSFETSEEMDGRNMAGQGNPASKYPYVSSDTDGGDLASGYTPSIAPR